MTLWSPGDTSIRYTGSDRSKCCLLGRGPPSLLPCCRELSLVSWLSATYAIIMHAWVGAEWFRPGLDPRIETPAAPCVRGGSGSLGLSHVAHRRRGPQRSSLGPREFASVGSFTQRDSVSSQEVPGMRGPRSPALRELLLRQKRHQVH